MKVRNVFMFLNVLGLGCFAIHPTQAAEVSKSMYELPHDVNNDLLKNYVKDGNIPSAQRLFDNFSWQTFIALNWPANPKTGKAEPEKKIGNGSAPLVWEFYRQASSIFLPDGAKPASWEAGLSKMTGEKNPDITQLLDESLQAFKGPLVDQNGKWVRYNVVVNKTEFDYLYANELYNLDGQAAYTNKHIVDFPVNTDSQPGSMEIKLSWKQLGENDDPSRYIVRKAMVVHTLADDKGNLIPVKPTLETMGLVGMHITVRTKSSPTWVWATFEQVDNVAVNDLEKDSRGKPLRPSFNNPDAPTMPVNVLAEKNAAKGADGKFTTWAENLTTEPVQVLQVLPIPKPAEELNRQMRALLANEGSVLQYYQLIGTQWPVEPDFPAFPGGTSVTGGTSAPESILYKIPGKVVPVYLGNNTMETFFQDGNQKAGPLAEDDRLPDGEVADPTTVFGTESCAGCHFSAGACIGFKTGLNGKPLLDSKGNRIPIFGKNGNFGKTGGANFSWMFQIRSKAKPIK